MLGLTRRLLCSYRRNRPPSIDGVWRPMHMVSHRSSLAELWLSGHGIETGALHNPLRLPRAGPVQYVAYKTRIENQARYPELKGQEIVDTDIVDDGCTLNPIADRSLHLVIANHALQHSPAPWETPRRWRRKPKPGGVLCFAVPNAHNAMTRAGP
jgi:hypothetical protein